MTAQRQKGTARATRKHPKPFCRFIIEAIDEVAPGQGEAIYWRAFDPAHEYMGERQAAEAAQEVRRLLKRDRKNEWKVGDLFWEQTP
jgi:hypothetical protein